MEKLKLIFKANWKSISLSYLVTTLSYILIFFYPMILGNTIDHLINKDYYYIIYLGLVFVGFIVSSYFSQIYDTIVFSRIKKELAYNELTKQFETEESSKINGRFNMIQNVVSFFETDVISLLSSAITIFGSLIVIFSIDFNMGLGLLLTAGVILGLSKYYSPYILRVRKKNNDLLERQADIIDKKDNILFSRFLDLFRKIEIKNSNINAKFYGFIQMTCYTAVTLLLFYYISNGNVTVGNTFSTYRYLFDFCNGVIMIPIVINRILNIKDVLSRF